MSAVDNDNKIYLLFNRPHATVTKRRRWTSGTYATEPWRIVFYGLIIIIIIIGYRIINIKCPYGFRPDLVIITIVPKHRGPGRKSITTRTTYIIEKNYFCVFEINRTSDGFQENLVYYCIIVYLQNFLNSKIQKVFQVN